jgi:mono/diheme cytochrome c family protein
MRATVQVVPRADYDTFVAKRALGGVDLGREEWEGVCQKCHRLDHKYIGPALAGNSLLADRKAIEVLLRNGQGQMPAVGRDWTSQQLDALIAYTKQFVKKGGNG